MRSQDNINKAVSQERGKIIYCLWNEWQIFPFADKINKLPGKKTEVYKFRRPATNTKGRGPLFSQAKAEIQWSRKRKGETWQLLVCVLRPSHYFTKRVPATDERYVRTLSDCIPTTHNRRCRRIKNRLFVVCPAVRYALLSSGEICVNSCSYKRMVLVLNNPQRLIYHKTKIKLNSRRLLWKEI